MPKCEHVKRDSLHQIAEILYHVCQHDEQAIQDIESHGDILSVILHCFRFNYFNFMYMIARFSNVSFHINTDFRRENCTIGKIRDRQR